MAMNAETRIGDFRVEVSKLPAMRAVTLSARIGRFIGPAAAAAFTGGGGSIADANVELVARVLFDRMESKELEGILRDLLSGTQVDGHPVMEVFDIIFADKLELVIPLVKFVLTFQFGSFGRALLAAGGAMMVQAVPKESDSTSTKS